MACMEHNCTACGWMDFSNTGGPASCPKCGARVVHFFDEVPDREPPERERFCDDDEADEEE